MITTYEPPSRVIELSGLRRYFWSLGAKALGGFGLGLRILFASRFELWVFRVLTVSCPAKVHNVLAMLDSSFGQDLGFEVMRVRDKASPMHLYQGIVVHALSSAGLVSRPEVIILIQSVWACWVNP